MSKKATTIKLEDYALSPVHYAVAVENHTALSRLVSSLPRLANPSRVLTEPDSLTQEETPLHVAIRLNDAFAARTLASAGADISLQNSSGWNPLQEALCCRSSDIALILAKWHRHLPRLVAVLRRIRDFYMEISFHFKSSIVPFVGKIAPSDTYKIWKREGKLRADTSLAGFDGLKIQRANQSFLFLGDVDHENNVPEGSLLVLNHNECKIFDGFENTGDPMADAKITAFCSQTSVYRLGMDVTKAELVSRTN
ncbi:hypothetical protein Ancab_001380 [Ancistrocladus abbreviatus]